MATFSNLPLEKSDWNYAALARPLEKVPWKQIHHIRFEWDKPGVRLSKEAVQIGTIIYIKKKKNPYLVLNTTWILVLMQHAQIHKYLSLIKCPFALSSFTLDHGPHPFMDLCVAWAQGLWFNSKLFFFFVCIMFDIALLLYLYMIPKVLKGCTLRWQLKNTIIGV